MATKDSTFPAAAAINGTEKVPILQGATPANVLLPLNAILPSAGYIEGLSLIWNSGTSLSVGSGAAYIPSLKNVLDLPSGYTLSGLSLTASTWYHAYLYLDGSTPKVELVTTAPSAAYHGTARAKSGDTSRRYIGSVLTDAAANIFNFRQIGLRVIWYAPPGNAPFLVLSGGQATTMTNISFAQCVPTTAKLASIQFFNTDSAATARLGNSDFAAALSTAVWLARAYPLGAVGQVDQFADFPLDSTQQINYLMTGSVGTGGLTVRCSGYVYER